MTDPAQHSSLLSCRVSGMPVLVQGEPEVGWGRKRALFLNPLDSDEAISAVGKWVLPSMSPAVGFFSQNSLRESRLFFNTQTTPYAMIFTVVVGCTSANPPI